MTTLKYWLWLSDAELSLRAKAAVMQRYGDAERAFFAPTGELAQLEGVSRSDAEILEKRDLRGTERILAACDAQGLTPVSYQDAAYPARLKNVFSPPPVLYVKGRLPRLDDAAAIAVVGTRRATPYGLRMARNLAAEIIACGGVLVSGLTGGIDAAAAEGALLADGICVGVLGTPHECERGFLSDEVAEKGAVVSEYAPGTPTRRAFFRARNRITAGLSVGVVAVEAPERSGTRLFVEEAMEQGKEIFAVPGNADAENSVGTIDMLRDGAKPVTCGWDVMSEFAWRFPAQVHAPQPSETVPAGAHLFQAETPRPARIPHEKTKKVIDKEKSRGYIDLKDQLQALSETQLKILTAVDEGGTHIDDIIESTGLSAATVLAQLTVLEIKGFIRREAGRRVSLKTAKK